MEMQEIIDELDRHRVMKIEYNAEFQPTDSYRVTTLNDEDQEETKLFNASDSHHENTGVEA